MSKYELTEVTEEAPDTFSELASEDPTADMVEYGLRSGCTDAEYHLANRLQKLRCVALELATQLDEEGYMLDTLLLNLIDVEVEVKSTKRLTL